MARIAPKPPTHACYTIPKKRTIYRKKTIDAFVNLQITLPVK